MQLSSAGSVQNIALFEMHIRRDLYTRLHALAPEKCIVGASCLPVRAPKFRARLCAGHVKGPNTQL